jgi:hypothetical protein
MIKRIPHIVFLLILSCLSHFSFSQTVYVKASVDKNKILIGEPIHLKFEVTLPVGANAKWFALDSIPHFEFIEQSGIDTVSTHTSNSYKQIVTITSFDSGRWVIPSMSLDFNGRSYITDSFPVSVAFTNFDASQDYHDIKDILIVENPSTNYINWIIAAITLIALLGLIYFLRKRKAKVSEPVIKTTSKLLPIDEAMKSLQELKSKQLPENGQVKLYYTSLNDILRLFIMRRMSLVTMQKTNEELILQVRDLGLPNEKFISLAQTLRMSDAVKFAKYVPGTDDNEESFGNVKTSIELLNNLKT